MSLEPEQLVRTFPVFAACHYSRPQTPGLLRKLGVAPFCQTSKWHIWCWALLQCNMFLYDIRLSGAVISHLLEWIQMLTRSLCLWTQAHTLFSSDVVWWSWYVWSRKYCGDSQELRALNPGDQKKGLLLVPAPGHAQFKDDSWSVRTFTSQCYLCRGVLSFTQIRL